MLSSYKIEINLERKYIDGGPYSRTKVFAIKLLSPIFMNPCPQSYSEMRVFAGEVDLAEYIMGSTAFYKSSFNKERVLQISTIIPSLISKDSLDLFVNPHRMLKKAGFLGIYIPINREMVEEFTKRIAGSLKLIALDEVACRSEKDCEFLCKFLDPKMVLKIIVQNYFPGVVFDITDHYNKLSVKPRLFRTVPFIRLMEYNYFGEKIPLTLFGKTRNVNIVYTGLKTTMLEYYISEYLIPYLKESNYCPIISILNSYSKYVNNRLLKHSIRSRIPKGEIVDNLDIVVKYNLNKIAYGIYLGMLELGAHALAHMLMKYLAYKLKVSIRQLQELILIKAPLPPDLTAGDLKKLRLINTIVDGYIYRFHDEGCVERGLMVLVVLRSSYSQHITKTLYESLGDNMKEDILRFIKEYVVGKEDKCYKRWFSNRASLITMLSFLKSSLREPLTECNNAPKGDIIDSVKNLLEELFNLNINIHSPNDLRRKLFIPLSQLRRYIYKTLYKNIAKTYVSNDDEALNRCVKNIRKSIKYYLPAIYNASVPDCYDGCYNCVLTEGCTTPGPIIREWNVSKYAMLMLLNNLKPP